MTAVMQNLWLTLNVPCTMWDHSDAVHCIAGRENNVNVNADYCDWDTELTSAALSTSAISAAATAAAAAAAAAVDANDDEDWNTTLCNVETRLMTPPHYSYVSWLIWHIVCTEYVAHQYEVVWRVSRCSSSLHRLWACRCMSHCDARPTVTYPAIWSPCLWPVPNYSVLLRDRGTCLGTTCL